MAENISVLSIFIALKLNLILCKAFSGAPAFCADVCKAFSGAPAVCAEAVHTKNKRNDSRIYFYPKPASSFLLICLQQATIHTIELIKGLPVFLQVTLDIHDKQKFLALIKVIFVFQPLQ